MHRDYSVEGRRAYLRIVVLVLSGLEFIFLYLRSSIQRLPFGRLHFSLKVGSHR